MDGGTSGRDEVVGTPHWAELTERLLRTTDQREHLALAAGFVSRWSSVIKGLLPSDPFGFVAGIDLDPSLDPSRSASRVIDAATDEDAASAVVELVYRLDRTLSAAARANPGASPRVWWGPFPGLRDVATELMLLAASTRTSPVQRQDLEALILTHHRLLLDGPGGLVWDVDHLAGTETPAERRVIAGRLGRRELKLGAWPGAVDVSVTVDGKRCAAVGPTDQASSERLVGDCIDAVRWAGENRVDVLVLPELYLPSDQLHRLEAELKAGTSGDPTLTIVGLSHQAGAGGRWLNEAVLLGPRGRVLDRYAKVNGVVTSGPEPIRECLDHGNRIVLRSTPFGWLGLSICMDVFAPLTNRALETAAPALVVVPSLSPSTTAHRNAAEGAAARGVASVVANRPLGVPLADAPSFHCPQGGAAATTSGPLTWAWLPHS